MKTQLRKDFQRFLVSGAYCTPPGRAACALSHARTLAEWREAEQAGLVRLRVEPEQESYFDVYGKPETEKQRAMIEAQLERDGCWVVVSEVNQGDEMTGDNWEIADAIGMNVYNDPCDPFENCYVPDLMRQALNAVAMPGTH